MDSLWRRIRFTGRALDVGLALLWHFADAASRRGIIAASPRIAASHSASVA
jgi:hypothetical protein